MIYITGDIHRDFRRIYEFARTMPTTKDDILIILGDVGINLALDHRDTELKEELERDLPLTLFCLKGNHEARPENIKGYKEVEWMGGKAYVEDKYPSLIFAKDGEVYDILGKKTLVIGGAYSVDKYIRQRLGYVWFEDEQPTEEIKAKVEKTLDKLDWKIDYVLTHDVPRSTLPIWNFSGPSPYENIDYTTEDWLEKIYQKLDFEKWYAGHMHVDSYEGNDKKVRIMYEEFDKFGGWIK